MVPSAPSGIYSIQDPCSGDQPFSYAKLAVYCDMETDGGGWTVIQRRNASMGWVNFTRGIADYEKGFGDLDGEFWMGLKKIYELTNRQSVAMKVSVWDSNGRYYYWNYPLFRINTRNNWYSLSTSMTVGRGSANYSPFGYEGRSTYFFAYDYYSSNNCGFSRQSGWWYYNKLCGNARANLNGRHQPSGLCGTEAAREKLFWSSHSSSSPTVYTHSVMMIRPQRCTSH